MNIIDKRRKENWNITLWATPRAVIVQIEKPLSDGNESEASASIDQSFLDWNSAMLFPRLICNGKSSEEALSLLEVTRPSRTQ